MLFEYRILWYQNITKGVAKEVRVKTEAKNDRLEGKTVNEMEIIFFVRLVLETYSCCQNSDI